MLHRLIARLGTLYVLLAALYGGAMWAAAHPVAAKAITARAHRAAHVVMARIDGWLGQAAILPRPVPQPIEAFATVLRPVHPVLAPPRRVALAHTVVPMRTGPVRIAAARPLPESFAPPPEPYDPVEAVRVKVRLGEQLTQALRGNFDLFLYVSKAAHGPVAQHMYVFARARDSSLHLVHVWPVSTGRETMERDPGGTLMSTATPGGYYELDPRRMYVRYRSSQWGARMPHAMFFNWVHRGTPTGLAIHASVGADIAMLGERDSAGCVHLPPKAAATLFDLIRRHYRGPTPRFAYDRHTRTLSNHGELARTASGSLRYFDGYRVLVVIENYGGGDTLAALD